ncbi:BlaI/MecI/CopY family transcriptional regulator [Aquiflexum gelatinilyticum]|uniref:BlaI/MecI/CopY family transcriptional regulator n=1 Tax=Aquiflexum gelatinilyticum TaxID=2961943 RepID=A0A9X2P5N4_9BACT|nr:BlaI/MecI/CopY family transcriptional regulator [Aquiflexum gelatinilyticum]MCR9016824.1 BlaI/MecI/CopY family transcriptional regulator [Aquiflexum gelatinilyticum]MCS4434259.1 BlaI/MecI/CopY family transcriptional regulator [Aquiflexum gelatinilyticum]
METLTKYEESLMRIFWKLNKALVRDVLNELPEPKPPYTTLASNIKLLEKKGYLDHRTYGNIHEYFPTITQTEYRKTSFNELLEDYFEGSVENVLSFMVKEKGLSEKDMEELQKLIDNMGNSSQP